jgi:hypothetical protein
MEQHHTWNLLLRANDAKMRRIPSLEVDLEHNWSTCSLNTVFQSWDTTLSPRKAWVTHLALAAHHAALDRHGDIVSIVHVLHSNLHVCACHVTARLFQNTVFYASFETELCCHLRFTVVSFGEGMRL